MVTFPLPTSLSTCVSTVGNVVVLDSPEVRSAQVFTNGAQQTGDVPFTGVQLSLPSEYFDRVGGLSCTMSTVIAQVAVGSTIGSVTLPNGGASQPTLTVNVEATTILGRQAATSVTLVSDWNDTDPYRLGFTLGPSGQSALLGFVAAPGVDAGPNPETVIDSNPIAIRFGITGGSTPSPPQPALAITEITCGPPL